MEKREYFITYRDYEDDRMVTDNLTKEQLIKVYKELIEQGATSFLVGKVVEEIQEALRRKAQLV